MKKLSKLSLLIACSLAVSIATAQVSAGSRLPLFRPKLDPRTDVTAQKPNPDSLGVRLKDLARFRGIRSNTLTGVGLVMGLNGTGDSTKVPPTIQMVTSYLMKLGIQADPTTLTLKNAAMVLVTGELKPFAVNGQLMDVTVTSMGDASSLRNGTLMLTELHAAGNPNVVYATAAGAISVGGYTEGAGGNSQAKGFVTVGRIPGGGIVEHSAPTNTVYEGKLFLELDQPDLTTAHRIESRINLVAPEFHAVALNAESIQLDLPAGTTATTAMAKLEPITVDADTDTSVIVNERTGTIVMGGSVRLSACAIATGSLSVKIDETNAISQPQSFSAGTTTPVKNSTLKVEDERAEIAVLKPNTTIADLAHIFQELKLKPSDIINIFQMLHEQGALKGRVIMQ